MSLITTPNPKDVPLSMSTKLLVERLNQQWSELQTRRSTIQAEADELDRTPAFDRVTFQKKYRANRNALGDLLDSEIALLKEALKWPLMFYADRDTAEASAKKAYADLQAARLKILTDGPLPFVGVPGMVANLSFFIEGQPDVREARNLANANFKAKHPSPDQSSVQKMIDQREAERRTAAKQAA